MSGTVWRSAIGAVVLAVGTGSALGAQPFQQQTAALAALPHESLVRVRSGDIRTEGRLQGLQGDTLVWRAHNGDRRTPLSELDAVWVSAGRATGKGALIGAAVGGGLLALGGSFILRATCDNVNGCRDEYAKVILHGGAVGGGSGALLGAGIGSLVRRWRHVYP